ncbi:LysR substrate-binding domain-containing protein [Sphingomonas arenae]|uniref:LysR substrate-binding domain-containing protein n=1 Tax=Sphingomonas arenae TaxID=2812555 RepID=UPI001967B8CA
MIDWNDWRYFLAVAETGSTLAAGRRLRVSQTTVARRIATLEESLSLILFERRPGGYALTSGGSALVEEARSLAAAADRVEQKARASGRDISGTVKLTTEEIFAMTLIAPWLRELREQYPAIRLKLDTSNTLRDLGAGEADVALRSTSKEQPAGIVGRAICPDDWTLYCSREYAERHGVPKSREALKRHAIIAGGGGNLARVYSQWLHELGLEQQIAMEHGSSGGLLTAVRSGIGIAALPCIVADGDPDLIRCVPPADHGRTMWLLTHERVRRSPTVRAVIDYLYERLMAHVKRLENARPLTPP